MDDNSINSKYTQLDTENYIQYAKRIINGRNDGVYDLEKSEVYELLTGEVVSGDHARKMLCFFEKIIEKVENEVSINNEETDLLDALELKRQEIQKERVKKQTVNLELNRTLRHTARSDLIWENVKESIKRVPEPTFSELKNEKGELTGIVGISDIHFSKKFKSWNNEYSIAICTERFNKLLYEIKEWVEDRNIKELHILNAGDSVEGLLRLTQLSALEIGVIDSVNEFSKFMAIWLNEVSKLTQVKIQYHHVISSNHTEIRFFNIKAGSFAGEDLEKLIINSIHDKLILNDNIEVPIYKTAFAEFSINGKNIVAIHGHQLKGKKVTHVIYELERLLKKRIDILISGHKHHEELHTVGENELGNVKFIMLPSMMGSDEYSDTLFTGSLAGATFLEFNENKKGLGFIEVILN